MRNILFFATLFVSLQVCGQKVIADRVSKDGMRFIATEEVLCRNFTDKVLFSYGMQYTEKGSRKVWSLSVTLQSYEPLRVDRGHRLLIKTKKDNVLELQATMSTNADPKVETIGNTILTTYLTTTFFDITSDNIMMLINEGVQKVRIETNLNYKEVMYKKDKVGKALSECYGNIIEAMRKNDIHEDF